MLEYGVTSTRDIGGFQNLRQKKFAMVIHAQFMEQSLILAKLGLNHKEIGSKSQNLKPARPKKTMNQKGTKSQLKPQNQKPSGGEQNHSHIHNHKTIKKFTQNPHKKGIKLQPNAQPHAQLIQP